MIPLRLKAHLDADAPPFVARLNSRRVQDPAPADAVLLRSSETSATYQTAHGVLEVFGLNAVEMEADVVAVFPAQGTAHRFIRAQSGHNTLLITERCDQLCQMCSQPPKDRHEDHFALFRDAIRLAPAGSMIGISGGEPLLYKQALFDLLLSSHRERPDIRFHVLSNAQHFIAQDRTILSKLRAVPVLWGIPLYSPDIARHDEIVGKEGAFTRLMESFHVLAESGSSIELRTVVLKSNARDLPRLANMIATFLAFIDSWAIMQLENIGFGRANWDALFFDNSEDFSTLAAAIDIATARGIKPVLYNFPLCTVPEPYRLLAPSTISDWKRRYLDLCISCPKKTDCGGFFEWYPARKGFGAIGLS
jgi:His-Xaa-Ser system radical SAM maturase HxsC